MRKMVAPRFARVLPAGLTTLLQRLWSLALPALVLCLSLGTSYYFWDKERRDIEQDLQAEFDTRVRETVGIFRERMLAYEQSLRAVHGLFAGSPQVARGDFQAFVANLRIENHPGLQGMGYSLLVPTRDKARHVAALRSQGFPAYAILPAGEREVNTAAIYFEPSGASLLSTLGSDYFAEPSRRLAMEAARDTNGIAISNKIKLPEEDAAQVQAGYRMLLPVYQSGQARATLSERRANIAGWIYAAFSMDGLMSNILGERTNIIADVIDDGLIPHTAPVVQASAPAVPAGTPAGERRRSAAAAGSNTDQLTDTYSDRVGGESSVKLFYASQRVEIGGYAWTVTARSLPNFATPVALSKLQLVARIGVVASMLLALLTWLLVRRRIRILRAAQQLRAAKEQAEAASNAKTQFLAAASHDLRQPIQALSLFTATLQAMAKRSTLTGAEVGRVVAQLQLALGGMGRLLNGLFDLSRLDSGTVVVTKQPVRAADLLAELNNTFAGPALEKGLRFKVRMPRASVWVDADPEVLARVLSNLTANALRYTERGRILIGCRRRAGSLDIQVLDTGTGIAADHCANIFGEFYQVPDVPRQREHGLGLGLAIVQRLVALLGGRVWVRSTPAKGSVFSVSLPRAAAPVPPLPLVS